jgi:uncharacterized membrane protein
MTALLAAVLVAAVVTTGLAVGLLWAWAVAVLPALRTADDTLFVEFTQRVNVAIINPRLAGYAATVGITRAVNIPLNNRMDAAREPGPARAMFETRWSRWNVVRTLTGVLSLTCLGWALAVL